MLEYMSTLTYIRTCTVIHISTCGHVALQGLEPVVHSDYKSELLHSVGLTAAFRCGSGALLH